MKTSLSLHKIFIIFVSTLLVYSCATKSKFDRKYPQYTKVVNTIESYDHLNDTTLAVSKFSTDPNYGRRPEKPIFIGVTNIYQSDYNRKKFLNALLFEDNTELGFKRLKSCCPFKTPNHKQVGRDQHFGLLEVWEVFPLHSPHKKDTLYINANDQGTPLIPTGYSSKLSQ